MSSLFLALAVLAAAPSPADRPRLVTLDLTVSSGVDPEVGRALTQAVTSEVSGRGYYSVVSSQDIAAVLGIERQKQLLGCAEESTSCTAELAGALGARFVLTGSLVKLGESWQLGLQTVDTARAQPIGRSTRLARSIDELRRLLPWSVAEATATPLPQAPSRALPIAGIALGGAAIIGGGVIGLLALTKEAEVTRELELGRESPQVLGPRSEYLALQEQTSLFRTISLVSMIAGAVLVAAGIIFMPSDVPVSQVAVLFTGTGAAVTGSF